MRAYNDIQAAYAEKLEADAEVTEFFCNVLLDGLEIGEYSSDFLCVRTDGERFVQECVERKHLMKPKTVKLLDASRGYWRRHGIEDWGLVIDAER